MPAVSPQIIKGFSGLREIQIGLLNAIPYLGATVAMVLAGRHSDQTGERRWHVAAGAFASAIGFSISARAGNLALALTALVLAYSGIRIIVGPFWAFSTSALSGTAAAGGIAWINSVGNLGGFIGPAIVGQVRTATGSYSIALFSLSGVLVLLGLLALTMRGGSTEIRVPNPLTKHTKRLRVFRG